MLPCVVLQHERPRALQHAGARRRQTAPRAGPARCASPPASTPISRTLAIVDERVEDADGVAAAADAGDDGVGQPARLLEASARRASRPITDWNSRTISG